MFGPAPVGNQGCSESRAESGSGRWLLLLGTKGRHQRAIPLERPPRAGTSAAHSSSWLLQALVPQRRLSYHVWKGNCILVHPQATTSAREEGPMDSEALEPDCPSSPFSFLNCQRLLPTHPQAQLGSLPCLTLDVSELTFCESVDCQGGSCSSKQNLKIQKTNNICNALSCITFLSSHQNSVAQPGKRINIQF